MILQGSAFSCLQAFSVMSAIVAPYVVNSVTTDPLIPLTCGFVVCSGPSGVPCTTTGMPAATAWRAQDMIGGPDTAFRRNASYFCDAIASLQFDSSFWMSLLESKVVISAPCSFATCLAESMMICSTGLACTATKCAMCTLFSAPSPLLAAWLAEPPSSSSPHAAIPSRAASSMVTAQPRRRPIASHSSQSRIQAPPPAPVAQIASPGECAQRTMPSAATSVRATSSCQRPAPLLARRMPVGGAEHAAEVRRVRQPPARGDAEDRLVAQQRIAQVAAAALDALVADPLRHTEALALEQPVQVARGDVVRARDLLRAQAGRGQVLVDVGLDAREQHRVRRRFLDAHALGEHPPDEVEHAVHDARVLRPHAPAVQPVDEPGEERAGEARQARVARDAGRGERAHRGGAAAQQVAREREQDELDRPLGMQRERPRGLVAAQVAGADPRLPAVLLDDAGAADLEREVERLRVADRDPVLRSQHVGGVGDDPDTLSG